MARLGDGIYTQVILHVFLASRQCSFSITVNKKKRARGNKQIKQQHEIG